MIVTVIPLQRQSIKLRFSIAALLFVTLAFGLVFAKWSHGVHREAKIERGVHLIAAMDDDETGPLALIRAVNHLHSLGHADAIETLRRFARSHPLDEIQGRTEIFNLDILIPILFVPAESGAKLPSRDWDRRNRQATKNRYSLDREDWRLPIEMSGDIPFNTEWQMQLSTGIRLESSYLIEWASRDGQLRDSQLAPSYDPFDAALDAAKHQIEIEMRSGNKIDEKYAARLRLNIENHMCDQVFAMVVDLVPDFAAPEWNNWSENRDGWKKLSAICKSRGLQWDRHKLQYVLTKRSADSAE